MRNNTTTSSHLHGSAIDMALAVAKVAQKADEVLSEQIEQLAGRVAALEEKPYTDAYVQDVEDRLDAAHDELIALTSEHARLRQGIAILEHRYDAEALNMPVICAATLRRAADDLRVLRKGL